MNIESFSVFDRESTPYVVVVLVAICLMIYRSLRRETLEHDTFFRLTREGVLFRKYIVYKKIPNLARHEHRIGIFDDRATAENYYKNLARK